MRKMFEKQEVPQEFMFDLCEEGLNFSQNGGYTQAPSMDNSCKYHTHTALVPDAGYCDTTGTGDLYATAERRNILGRLVSGAGGVPNGERMVSM